MTARDVETLIHRSPDLDQLWEDVLTHSNMDNTARLAAFAQEEVRAFVSYCVNAVESAPEVPEDSPGITKEIALGLRHSQEIFHETERDRRGRPVKARVNGKVKTWKKYPEHFELPVKYGMSNAFRLSQSEFTNKWDDPRLWHLTEAEAMQRNISAKNVLVRWESPNPGARGLPMHDPTARVSIPAGGSSEGIVVLSLDNLKLAVTWNHREPEYAKNIPAITNIKLGELFTPESLDAWRSTSAWQEFGAPKGTSTQPARMAAEHARRAPADARLSFFEYVGEQPPWQLAHTVECALARSSWPGMYAHMTYRLANRRCTCGALGDGVRENPRRRRR